MGRKSNDTEAVARLLRESPDIRSSAIVNLSRDLSRQELIEVYGEIQQKKELVSDGARYPEFTRTFSEVLEEAEWVESLLSGQGIVYPIVLEMHLGTFCNSDCAFCFSKDVEYEKGERLECQEAKNFLEHCKENGVREIWFSGGKEPLTSPVASDVILLANGLGYKTRLYTNGILMTGSVCEKLIDCSQVRVSVSSASQDTYQKVHGRRGAKLRTIMSNIERLVKLKNMNGSDVNVGVCCIIYGANYHEIREMVNVWRLVGVDTIQLRKESVGKTEPLNEYQKCVILDQMADICPGPDLDIRGLSEGELYGKTQFLPGMKRAELCRAGAWKRGIDPFGGVWNCDFAMHPGNRFSRGHLRLGGIRESSMEDILASAEYPPHCEICQAHAYGLNIQLEKLRDDRDFGISLEEQPWK